MSTILTRFVYRDGDAYAIFKATFTDTHPDRIVLATVSLGLWDEQAGPDQRVAFAIQLKPAPDRYELQMLSADQSLWVDSEVLGVTLDREVALAHPKLPELYAIADLMVAEDQVLREYLERGPALRRGLY
jgi:hypothetical protein